MTPRCLLPGLLMFAALVFSGCESGPSARIQEKSAIYATFSDDLKARIKQGDISIGDSTDAVYIALGKPSSIVTQATERGDVQIWTYKRFVIGHELSSRINYSQPAQRFAGTPVGGAAARLGGGNSEMNTAPTRGGPQAMLESSVAEIVTLHVDILDNKVFRLRVD